MNIMFTIHEITLNENKSINTISVLSDFADDGVPCFEITHKESFIEKVRELEGYGFTVSIYTSKKVKVQIVDDRYLRTEGDSDDKNDLLDLPVAKMTDYYLWPFGNANKPEGAPDLNLMG